MLIKLTSSTCCVLGMNQMSVVYRDFASMSHITTLLNWQALLSPTYMEMPQCTAVLASLLEIEAVWGLAVDPTANAGRSVPMLHDLLSNGYRCALHYDTAKVVMT